MKITYITPSGIPSKQANTVQVMKMCEAFAEKGHDVILICPNQNKSTDQQSDIFSYYNVKPIFDLKRLPWKPLKGYQFTLFATVVAYQNDTDLVYGRSIAGCYFSSLLGIYTVYESHVPADNIHPITDWMFRKLIKSNNLTSLIVISEALEEYYTSKYNVDDDIYIAPDAASKQEGAPIKEIQQASDLQVGYVGHLYEGKGISLIVELAEEIPCATFHIVGGTEKYIKMWREKSSNVSNVTFHGFVEPARVPDYLASFDVALAPYQREVHGAGADTDLSEWMSPLKIFEYMSAGVPIVCSNLPVLQEVLTHGETALLCPPDDVKAWTKAITLLQSDEKLKQKLKQKATTEFEARYSYEARAEKILNFLTNKVR